MQINLLDRCEYGYQKPHRKCSTCPDFQQMQLKEKIIHYEIAGKPWEVVGLDMFTLNKKLPFYCRLSQQVSSHQKDGRPIS